LVGAGLVIEYIVILRAIIATREAEILSEEKIASANERAAVAVTKAGEAELALARFRAPRALIDLSALSEAVKEFSGTKFDLQIGFWNDEFVKFARNIEIALVRAGWQIVDWQGASSREAPHGRVIGLETAASNVLICIKVADWDHLAAPANAVSDALSELGIDASFAPQVRTSVSDSANVNTVHVLIGPKR
jgi:hypothetical protein